MERLTSTLGEPVDYANLGALAGGRLPVLELIAAAARAGLIVHLRYDGESGSSERDVEPYALRQAKNGRLYVLAADLTRNGEVRSFRFDRIRAVEPTNQKFQPRYEVEFGTSVSNVAKPKEPGPLRVTPSPVKLSRGPQNVSGSVRSDYHPRARGGLAFTVVCPSCGRRFTEAVYRTSLAAHKSEAGSTCDGRHGFPI